MEVLVLGPLEVRRNGVVVAVGGPKQRGILALLVAHVGRPLSLDQIVEGIYGDEANDGSRRSVRTFISAIRRELGDAVRRVGSGYSLVVEAASIDAVQFEEQAHAAAGLIEKDPESAAESLREALALWRGRAYEDVDGAAVFEPEITRLEELRLVAIGDRIDAELACGRHRELVAELEALIGEYPLRERFRGQHMLALYRSGRQADALRAYERTRIHLVEVLGIDPSSELRNLEGMMLVQDPALDLVPAQPRTEGNLPARVSSFVGRFEEAAVVEKLLREHRLVTLAGLGGIGKTTLAIEVAHRVEEQWIDGVWLVRLEALVDAASVIGEVARALGVAEHPTRPLLEVVVDELAPRSLLLVVDNCEHLADEVAQVTKALLEGCPDVRVLATGRERLQLAGERTWSVPPLTLPGADTESSPATAAASDAVRLLVERVQEFDLSFELDEVNLDEVVAICRRLDGIPLAIELAAARLRALSPSDLLDRLEDRFALLTGGGRARPARQQTMLAAMDWSCDLLAPTEQMLLRRLAVFRGGFTLAAAKGVCAGDGVAVSEIVDHLGRLVDVSLVSFDVERRGRYWMLDSVRDYAATLLADSGEEAVSRIRHADYYRTMVPLQPDFDTPEFTDVLERVAADHGNYRAALAWAVEAGDGARALDLAVSLGRHWFFTAQAEESRIWLPRVLQIADPTPSLARALVLQWFASIVTWTGRKDEALAVVTELEATARALGDPRLEASAVFSRARYAEATGDLPSSRDLQIDHLEKTRHLALPRLSLLLGSIIELSVMLGDFDLAATLTSEMEDHAAALGQSMAPAWATSARGMLAHYQGDLSTAEELCRTSLEALTALGREQESEDIRELGQIALARGDVDAAAEWGTRLVEVGRNNLVSIEMVDGHALLARVALRRGHVARAAEAVAQALQIAVGSDDDHAVARVLAVAAQCSWAADQPEAAARMHAGAESLRGEIGFVHPALRAAELRSEFDDIEAVLGAEEFDRAWRRGAGLDRNQLIELARQELASPTPTG